MAVIASLPGFLRRMAAEPFVWGRFDCSLVIADWWLANHGTDPAPELRGAYCSRETCDRIVAGNGGLLRIVSRLARRVGARRTADPAPGDFAVLRILDEHYAAIRTPSGRWAVKSPAGLVALGDARVIAAWKV